MNDLDDLIRAGVLHNAVPALADELAKAYHERTSLADQSVMEQPMFWRGFLLSHWGLATYDAQTQHES